jgi:phage baseplate assembly protein W
MAVIVGQYILTGNNKSINDYAIGLSLPLQMGGNTFNQTYDNLEQLKSNVKNLLLTNQGERLAMPTFGCGLQRLLFEPNDEDLNDKILNQVESAVNYWLPQLLINSIEITASDTDKDKNTLNVSISFTAKYNQQNFSVDFKVNS